MRHQINCQFNNCDNEAQNLVASGYHLPPYMFLKTDSQTNVTHHTGVVVEFLLWISAYTKTKLSFVDIDKTKILKHGFGKTVTQQILKNVWLILLLTTLSLIAFTSFYQRYHYDRNSFELSVIGIIHRRSLYVIGILVGRSSNGNYYIVPYKALLSIRLAVGMLVLMTIVIFNAYTSALTSFLTLPKLKPIIQSFEELATSDKYCLIQPAHSDLLNLYLNATREPYKTLGDSLRRNPHHIIENYTEVLAERLLEYNGVFAHTETEIGTRIGADMMKHRKSSCRFTASKKLPNSISYSMVLRKGYLYGSFVNQAIIQIRETGLIQHWDSAYLPNIDKFLTYKHQSFQDEVRGVRALTIIHLSGAFVLVLIGNAMAIVAFLLEKFYWNISKSVG